MASQFLQNLADGVAVGALYALVALGYTLVYGILQFINFAHSDVFALGAWSSLTAAAALGLTSSFGASLPPFYLTLLVLLVAMGVCGLLGFIIERLAYRPLRNAPRLNVLITAIGISLLLQNVGQLETFRSQNAQGLTIYSVPFGPYPRVMPQMMPQDAISVLGIRFNSIDLIVLAVSVVIMLGIELLIFRTKIGLAMRAVSFNYRTAALMGVNVDRIISFTFVLGAMLAGAAGFLYSVKYPQLRQTADTVWVLFGLKAFVAAVVGGIGNVRGAMIGGLCIGVIEYLGVTYVSSNYRDVYVFSILILVLLVRPSGILGKTTVEKV
jgi:branched-chain amino acid transport system permease protein